MRFDMVFPLPCCQSVSYHSDDDGMRLTTSISHLVMATTISTCRMTSDETTISDHGMMTTRCTQALMTTISMYLCVRVCVCVYVCLVTTAGVLWLRSVPVPSTTVRWWLQTTDSASTQWRLSPVSTLWRLMMTNVRFAAAAMTTKSFPVSDDVYYQ